VETAFGLVLSIGLLCAQPEGGLMAQVMSESSGGKTARRLLPVAVALPFLVGWLSQIAKGAGWLGPGEDTAVFTFLLILVFSILIWINARVLNTLDKERQAALKVRLRLAAIVESSLKPRWPSARVRVGQPEATPGTEGIRERS
jgi:hypothetical protein